MMADPYKTLGISPNATDDEVKIAYKQLAKKYHPDNYVGNPIADLAEEKMKELNEAYDAIMAMRKNGWSHTNSKHNYSNNYSSNSQFSDIRKLISNNRFVEAEELLNGIPTSSRDAEWYFLKGCVLYSKGWLDDAIHHAQTAVSMNPNNAEYRNFYSKLSFHQRGGMNGFPSGYNTYSGVNGCSGCDLCAGLICADCLGELCCGVDICGCC